MSASKKSRFRTFTSEKYGVINIEAVPHAQKEVIVCSLDTRVLVAVKDFGISDEQAEKEVELFLRRKAKNRKYFGIQPASPDFVVNYPKFKMRLEEKTGTELLECGLCDLGKEDDWWIVYYPPTTDFFSEIEQERLFMYFDQVLRHATNDYLNIRGKEIAQIIGTDTTFLSSSNLEFSILGQNKSRLATPLDKSTAYDEDNNSKWVNETVVIKSSLLIYPHEYIDSVIIHELIHNFFFDHGEDFHSTTDYYCEKILGHTEREIALKYADWQCVPFAEKPIFKDINHDRVPSFIWVNGRRLRRVSEREKPKRVYLDLEA